MDAPTTAAATRDEFLQLLMVQLRHQDPLEPMKQEDFLSQLAQFSQLEGIEKLNTSFDAFLDGQQASTSTQRLLDAASLVGKHVVYGAGSDGSLPGQGEVSAVSTEGNQVLLRVGDELLTLDRLKELATDSTSSTD